MAEAVLTPDVTPEVAPDVTPEGTTETPAGPHWSQQLTDVTLHNAESLTRYKTLDTFVTGALETRSEMDKRVSFPGDAASEADWAAFHAKMPGFPAKADAYEVTMPEQPAAQALQAAELTMVFERFHALGLTNTQAQGNLTLLAELNALRSQGASQETHAAETAMLDTFSKLEGWGTLTERNMAIAEDAIERNYGADNAWWHPMENSPEFYQMAFALGLSQNVGRFIPGGVNADSVDSAKAAIAQSHTDFRAGTITESEYNAITNRHGPLAYSERDGEAESSLPRSGAPR